MAEHRRRFKQTQSLKQRLLDRVNSLREEAKLMRPCFERDTLLRKARQAESPYRRVAAIPGTAAARVSRGTSRISSLHYRP